ncbi:unnamed protein product [Linum trigynum]|uniref:Uncharacterized protein n=1 Tax=Linum trigynum TaxID=586398 RepID=A0AAV2DWH5_9ROSI
MIQNKTLYKIPFHPGDAVSLVRLAVNNDPINDQTGDPASNNNAGSSYILKDPSIPFQLEIPAHSVKTAVDKPSCNFCRITVRPVSNGFNDSLPWRWMLGHRLLMRFQTAWEKTHSKNKWSMDSSCCLQSSHRLAIIQPRFFKLSVVNIFLWKRVHAKKHILEGIMLLQTDERGKEETPGKSSSTKHL